jgi:RND family efflux transporter MFP subunit
MGLLGEKLVQMGVGAVALVLAVGLAVVLVIAAPEPAREERPLFTPTVRVHVAQRVDAPITIHGYGEVRPAVRSKIIPQVSGRVLALHEGFHTGGFIARGEPLLEIDETDFELAVRTAEADLANARAARQTSQARLAEARIKAEDEAEELRQVRDLHARQVATDREVERARVRAEQAAAALDAARAAVASSDAQLAAAEVATERAGVDLARTRLVLPFDAVIVEESVDPGQHVSAGQSVGEAYGTQSVEIVVPLEDRELGWLESLPLAPVSVARSDPQSLPRAQVKTEFAGRACEWEGRAVRTEGQVDPRSRMVRVVVRVENPFQVSDRRPPLMPGAFVEVAIEGRSLAGVIALPRQALREDGTVWIVEDGRLWIRSVQIVRLERSQIYVSGGIDEGQAVVLTPLNVVVDGMAVQVAEGPAGSAAALGDVR